MRILTLLFRIYSSVSNVSKRSNDKTIRIRWESFKRYYQTNYSNSENTQNYQISAMSLDQLMSLRKIALLQFSKLLERQHSTMIRYVFLLYRLILFIFNICLLFLIRTLRLFSKKNKTCVGFDGLSNAGTLPGRANLEWLSATPPL